MADAELDEVVARSSGALLRFAYLLCRDAAQAEDLVQDAFEKALGKWRRDGVPDHPAAYARRIIVNSYLGWRRRRVSGEVVGLHDDSEQGTSDGTDERAQRELMWQMLGALDPRQRTVLVLRYYEALPDHEIARHLGCADATVRSLAARAFAALRTHPQLAELAPDPTDAETAEA